jgi:hypothetical protein
MTKKNKAKRKRKAAATVESVTRELKELVSRHSNSEWESAQSHHSQYRRIRERELKKKDLTTEEIARLLDEQKGYQAGYSIHEKKRNLQKRLDKLKEAEPSEGDKPPDIPKQDVVSRAVESESFIPHQPAPEADDIPPVPQLRRRERQHEPNVATEEDSDDDMATEEDCDYKIRRLRYCLFCYQKHSGYETDHRSPFLQKTTLDPISIMEGGDGFRSAAKYCFDGDVGWSDHIKEAHPHVLTSHGLSQEEFGNTGDALKEYNQVSLFNTFAIPIEPV